MAKKFMFVCVGILALTVAFLLGAQFGRADYIDHTSTGVVACMGREVLIDDGTVWQNKGEFLVWEQALDFTLPVPVSQIRLWGGENSFVSTAGDLWVNHWTGPGQDDYEWVNAGVPPYGRTRTQPSTWGSIKAQFNK
jgi:hypothetical protein